MRRGQTTLEYILLIGIAAAGIIAVIVYVSRGHQGNLRSQADQLGAMQYAPGNTTINNSERKTLDSTASAGSSTTVVHGNLNEPNTVLQGRLAEIIAKWADIYALRQEWEDAVEGEADTGAKAFRAGTFDWVGTGLWLKEQYLDAASSDLHQLYLWAQWSQEGWPERTPDQTSSGSYSSEEGTIRTHKNTSETLGDL